MGGDAQAVLITGASSGIGAALARAYAARGAQLGLIARNRERLDAVLGELRAGALGYVADVGDAAAIIRAGEDFCRVAGTPAVVVANAGVSVGTLTEHAEDLDAFERVLRTNLLGMAATFQPFVQRMRERGSGTLVGIASVAGLRGLPGAAAYSASKAGAISYLESLRVELHGSGVRVVTVLPGYVDTPMTRINPYPMPFLLDADEAARRILRAIDRGARRAVIPWQMAIVARVLAMLPGGVFDRAFARAGRKPRGLPL